MIRKFVWAIAFGISLSILNGCAVSPETRAQEAPATLRLEPGQGMLALRVTSNRSAVSTYFGKWTSLQVKNIVSKNVTTIVDRSDTSAGHSLFINSLPVGTYEIVAVANAAYGGIISIDERAGAGNVLPRFQVSEGHLTDLGTLAYVRRHYPMDSREFRWAQQDSPYDRIGLFRQLDQTLSNQLSSNKILTWDQGAQLSSRRDEYSRSRPLTMRAMSPFREPDGTLYLGESFGQIAVRSPSGLWRRIETPTALPIRSLYINSSGSMYAGSDDGVFLVRSQSSGPWESIPLPVPDASVIHIGGLAGTKQTFVVLQTRDRFVGLSLDPSSATGWRELFSRQRALFLNPLNDANGAVYAGSERVVFATRSVDGKIEVASPATDGGNWKFSRIDEGGNPITWAIAPGGTLGRFKGIPLTGMYFSASRDGGITWEKRGELNWANGSLLFVTDRIGYVVRLDSIPAFDPEKGEFSIWRTDDAGQTWTKAGSAPAIFGKLLFLGGTPNNIGYVSGNGKFFTSEDGGKAWKLEREVE